MLSPHVFRAYDIRGIYKQDIDEQGMKRIGYAYGNYLKSKKNDAIVVGMDIRFSSESLSKALKEGLLASGLKIYDVGMTSFGVSIFSAWSLKKPVGYVTASHLPPEWNGLKMFYSSGLSLNAKEIERIGRDAVKTKDVPSRKWNVERIEMLERYINFMKKYFDCSGIKVVVDCGGGAMSLVVPKTFRAVGIDTIGLFCDVDPSFSKRDMEPSEESLGELVRTIKRNDVDFGVGFDGDGDRVVIVDEKGNVLSADQVVAVVGKEILAKEKGIVIATVECSMIAEHVLGKLGAKVIRVPVGHTFIMQAAKDYNALLAYEDTGHMSLPRIALFDDAMLITLKLASILAKSEKTLSQLVGEIPVYPRKREAFKCSDETKFAVVKRLEERYKKQYKDINVLDGVRIQFHDAWVLIRASNTASKIRLTVEAKTKKRVDELAKEFMEELDEEIKRFGE